MRELSFSEAIREGTDIALNKYDNLLVLAEGVNDPLGIVGTITGFLEKYGKSRIIDLPLSENCFTGISIGLSINGFLPLLIFQRIDFMLLAMDQIVNNAAKWNFMFGGQRNIPLVIRCTIGQGWGMGSQHSNCLQSIFSHFPGLKVVYPSNAYDAKGLLLASIKDRNPVIIIENYQSYSTKDNVPLGYYEVAIGKSKVVSKGTDFTIVTYSYCVNEALEAAKELSKYNISIEIIDLVTISPLDETAILNSIKKTHKLLIVDPSNKRFSISGEICGIIFDDMDSKNIDVTRLNFPEIPTPASFSLEKHYYPNKDNIVKILKNKLL
jgi:pyruvate/2-oxoglutarate/acetoin dehydrogenase E1 component